MFDSQTEKKRLRFAAEEANFFHFDQKKKKRFDFFLNLSFKIRLTLSFIAHINIEECNLEQYRFEFRVTNK